MTRRFYTEKEALNLLQLAGFEIDRRTIRYPKGLEEADLTMRQIEAIAYLCDEWDYSTP